VPANPQGSAVAGRDGDRIVVWLRGEHDIATTVELSETLVRAIAIDDADLVVDLSEVQFIDASTIGVIVTPGQSEQAGEGATVPSARRGP
jgi:anti-anti-sigma factor